ncbi:MAG: PfkB family carbohydrate kinase, partial [Acidobacteriota bacterium]
LTPNLKELGLATVGEALCDDEQVVEAARLLIESCELQAVLVTRGADGMSLVESSGRTTRLKAQAREVFDVSGAGDTAIAVMAAAIASGAPLPQAAELSNLAAGIVVGKVGTAVTRADDLLQALHRRDLGRAEAKVLSRRQAREQMEVWRRQGRSVGFTNGVFDLLHPGHLAVLRRASEECDLLIVGLNGDASVHLLKGSGPVQNEATRSTILASLEMVDAVVIFPEETPLPLLEALRPDALIKGANYRLDEVVGGDLVRSWGGRVVLAQIQDHGSAAIAELTEGTF